MFIRKTEIFAVSNDDMIMKLQPAITPNARLTSPASCRLIGPMRKTLSILGLFSLLLVPAQATAVDQAPRISDREIVERLTVLEEGLQHVEESLRAEIRANREAIDQLRKDMERQNQQLREDMNTQFDRIASQFGGIDSQFDRIDAQFDRMFQLTLGILAAFAAIVASTIGFAIWDRRTMIRPFETKVKEIEEELSQNRQRLHAFLEALQSLGQSDERVAEVLKKFNLL